MIALRPVRRRRPTAIQVLALIFVVMVVAASALPHPQRDPLLTWSAALANQARRPAKIVAIGESTTEGQGVSARENRWLNLLAAQLRQADPGGGAAGGENYVPATYRVYEPDSLWGRPYSSTGSVSPSSGRATWATARWLSTRVPRQRTGSSATR